MPKHFYFPLLLLLTLLLSACPEPDPGPSRIAHEPEITPPGQNLERNTASTPEETAALPFTLRINGEIISTNPEAQVSEGEITTIDISSSGILEGEIRVLHPDGTSIPLGEWQADQTQFIHSFPYGENHLILLVDENVYDILVVSGAPQITPPGQDCANPFFDFTPDAVSILTETALDELPATWTHRIVGMSEYEDNNTAFTFLMQRAAGLEGNIDHTVSLDLMCIDNVTLISTATETFDGIEWTTEYPDGTIYLPATLQDGVTWERHGVFTGHSGTDSISFDLVERFRCTGEETISIIAGEFNTFRVDFSIEKTGEDDTFTTTGTSWYVPGIGRVLTESTLRLELTSHQSGGS